VQNIMQPVKIAIIKALLIKGPIWTRAGFTIGIVKNTVHVIMYCSAGIVHAGHIF
jgi:hypothetical protein